MVLEHVQNKNKIFHWVLNDQNRNSEPEEILRVLRRAAADNDFIAQLTDQGSLALQGYDLSQQAKAALVSGDLPWVEARVGKLTARLRTWIDRRLQQEIW